MKKYGYYLCAAAAIALIGCKDDVVVEKTVTPAQTGDEITFGSSLTDVGTRTIYGDTPVDGAYPVYWEEGDEITIYCPEAAQTKLVSYKVSPDETDGTHSSTVTKINTDEAGLQWGAAETHHFYAFYPASAVAGEKDGKIEGEIPTEQDPVRWTTSTNENGGTTYTGVANTDYAFMWAYGEHDKKDGGDVALTFHPWVTILDIVINGPANPGEKVKMSSIQVRSLNNDILNGKFVCDMSGVQAGTAEAPTYQGVVNTASTRNQISIQLYNNDLDNAATGQKGDFITLEHNDQIVVRAYLLPTAYDTSDPNANQQQIQIRVAPFNSAVLTRTLNAQDGTAEGGIVAHKVNKVILPSVTSGGINYWMSSLDPNIYVTELSLPGSKMSYQTTGNGANVAYQNLSIKDQFTNGIRAFQIQTASTNTGAWDWDAGSANDQVLYMTVAGNKTNTRFKNIVKEIADELNRAEKVGNKYGEYAFILLTAALGECDSYGRRISGTHVNGELAWMDAIRNELAEMTADNDTYRIYTNEITNKTTINDVAGHIIIKVNYNTQAMANHLTDSDEIPVMFAQWGPEGTNQAYRTNPMKWGTSYGLNVDDMTTGPLKWFYHEATSVGFKDNGGEEKESVKKANIEDMWKKSIAYYNANDNHDMWFLNDLGGCYVNEGYSSGEAQNGVNDWTKVVGPYATNLLQNRTEDATLGIVLMNFADPNDDYTGNLIQTIINNNFNFQLRTASTTTTNYNAVYSKGGNAVGWE
jgi:hypothetical protein